MHLNIINVLSHLLFLHILSAWTALGTIVDWSQLLRPLHELVQLTDRGSTGRHLEVGELALIKEDLEVVLLGLGVAVDLEQNGGPHGWVMTVRDLESVEEGPNGVVVAREQEKLDRIRGWCAPDAFLSGLVHNLSQLTNETADPKSSGRVVGVDIVVITTRELTRCLIGGRGDT